MKFNPYIDDEAIEADSSESEQSGTESKFKKLFIYLSTLKTFYIKNLKVLETSASLWRSLQLKRLVSTNKISLYYFLLYICF